MLNLALTIALTLLTLMVTISGNPNPTYPIVMLRFWFFHLDSILIRFFTKNSMSVRFRFRFFRQEISYTSPINLGTAMLNYSGEADEASDDSEVADRRPPIHACAYVKFCRHTLHGYGSTLRRFDCCMLCEK